jgi:hypothetical protein
LAINSSWTSALMNILITELSEMFGAEVTLVGLDVVVNHQVVF